MAVERLTITAGDSLCTLSPATGGSLTSWHVNGQPMLRTAATPADPLDMASFPLVPYSNRIGRATFEWAGARINLARNFLPEPHAIHGVGWKRAWTVESQTSHSVSLTLTHSGDENWPWPFKARQIISVNAWELRLHLSAINLADYPVPLSFGHHPYFDQTGASLRFNAAHVWMADDDNLPSTAKEVSGQLDFSTGAGVEGRAIDYCYTGVSGDAHIEWTDRPLALDVISTLPAAVVYIPLGGAAFCFEPVPHLNNALNLSGGEPAMATVEPDCAFETAIMFRAVPKA